MRFLSAASPASIREAKSLAGCASAAAAGRASSHDFTAGSLRSSSSCSTFAGGSTAAGLLVVCADAAKVPRSKAPENTIARTMIGAFAFKVAPRNPSLECSRSTTLPSRQSPRPTSLVGSTRSRREMHPVHPPNAPTITTRNSRQRPLTFIYSSSSAKSENSDQWPNVEFRCETSTRAQRSRSGSSRKF